MGGSKHSLESIRCPHPGPPILYKGALSALGQDCPPYLILIEERQATPRKVTGPRIGT